MRIRVLVAAAAVALIVPAVPAFATETPSPTTDESESASAEPTTTPESTPAEPATEPETAPAAEPEAESATDDRASTKPTDQTRDAADPEAAQSEATLTVTPGTYKAGSSIAVGVDVTDHAALGEPYVFVWSVASETTTTKGSGNLPLTLDESGHGSVMVPVPDGLASGTYRMGGFVAGENAGAPFTEHPVVGTIDSVKPGVALSRSLSTFYLYKDGYRDSVSVKMTFDEVVSYTAKVVTSGGTLVRTLGSSASFQGAKSYTWNGYNNAGNRVSGTYYIRVDATDKAGNASSARTAVAASSKKLTWKTYYKKVTAKDVLESKYVGSCSTLKAPARSDWPGSRGLRSNVRCKAPATSSRATVSTRSVKCLPKSVDGNYRNLTLKHYGGRPKGYSKNVYMVSYVLRPSDWATRQRHYFGNSVQWKTMASVATPNGLIQSRTSSTYCSALWWTAGLNSSSRYDIWKYSVAIQYRVLA